MSHAAAVSSRRSTRRTSAPSSATAARLLARRSVVIAGVWLVPAFLAASETYLFWRLGGRSYPFWRAVMMEGPAWAIYALLTPVVFALGRRLPPRRPHLARNIAAHLAVSLSTGLLYATVATATTMRFTPLPRAMAFGQMVLAWYLSALPLTTLTYFGTLGVGLALDYFARAAGVAPHWPYPVYDAAFTYLLQRQYDKAFKFYSRTDQLAPRGFFTAKTAVHSLKQEREGKLPTGTYLAYLSLEWIEPEKRRQLVEALVERVPTFAPGWKAMAEAEQDVGKRLAYIEKGLALGPDPETKGFLLLNKASSLQQQGRTAEAKAIPGVLAVDPALPLDIEALSRYALVLAMRQQGR